MKFLYNLGRITYVSSLVLGLLLSLVNALVAAPISQEDSSSKLVYVLTFEGAVTPILDEYIGESIAEAVAENAQAIILQLDTPGGSVSITKSITQKMINSPIPVIVYVSPAGAHAGSAGTFITLAGHVAAMAPGSSIGAASPVGGSGEDIGETMEAKVTNILSADIENLASRRGEEATEWAIAAVQEAAAATAKEALELGVIDFIVADVAELAEKMNGFVVTVQGEEITLATEDAILSNRDLSPIQRFLNYLTNPSIATILLTIGSAGLLAEVWNPGTWIPGIIGIISLLLGLYALGQLEANYAGLALMVVAIILFVAEAFTPTFGLLALAGGVAFVLGGALLFNNAPGIETPWTAIITLAVALGGFTLFASTKALTAQRRPVLTGGEALIGQVATVKQDFGTDGLGSVYVAGEWWNARLQDGVDAVDKRVEVVDREGYTLIVR